MHNEEHSAPSADRSLQVGQGDWNSLAELADFDHNKILNAAAREVLRPLGFRQRGRSRMWFEDRGWWLVLVEFQPSQWSRGSYLNVGPMWPVESANAEIPRADTRLRVSNR